MTWATESSSISSGSSGDTRRRFSMAGGWERTRGVGSVVVGSDGRVAYLRSEQVRIFPNLFHVLLISVIRFCMKMMDCY